MILKRISFVVKRKREREREREREMEDREQYPANYHLGRIMKEIQGYDDRPAFPIDIACPWKTIYNKRFLVHPSTAKRMMEDLLELETKEKHNVAFTLDSENSLYLVKHCKETLSTSPPLKLDQIKLDRTLCHIIRARMQTRKGDWVSVSIWID